MDAQEPDERSMVNAAVADVTPRFPMVDPADVERAVRAEVHRISTHARVKTFVPVLAARQARVLLTRRVA